VKLPVVIEVHATGTGFVAAIVTDDPMRHEVECTSACLTWEDAVDAARELVLPDSERVTEIKDCDIARCPTCRDSEAA
jgi:hypothetical protein